MPDELHIEYNSLPRAVPIMQEVAAWARGRGFRVWAEEELTAERLVTPEAGPENFCVGTLGGEAACAFIIQWTDSLYWPQAPAGEALYLHKFCVRRSFAGRGMTRLVTEALRAECRRRGLRYVRLDSALDERAVRKIYLGAGYKIVNIIDYPNGRSMALYELEA